MKDIILLNFEGDDWRVLSLGATTEAGVICHLASLTRGRKQRNGFCPNQIITEVPNHLLQEAE